MEFNRKDLITALEKTKKFTGSGNANLAIVGNVLVTPTELRSTDLESYASVPLQARNYVRAFTEQPEAHPVPEDLKSELSELLKAQLESLCADYGIETPEKAKKADLVAAVTAACEKAFEAEKNAKPINVEVEESFCIDPKVLLGIAKTSAEDHLQVEVVFEKESMRTSMFAQESRWRPTHINVGKEFQEIHVMDPKEFPDPPDVGTGALLFSAAGAELGKAISAATVASDEMRPHLVGLWVEPAKNRMVSCNGSRLHITNREIAGDNDLLLIPVKAVKKLIAVAGKEDPVDLALANDTDIYTIARINDMRVTVRNLAGDVPPLGELLTPGAHVVTVKKADLVASIAQAGVVASKDYSSVAMKFNGGIDAKTENPDLGSHKNTNVPFVTGGPFEPQIETALKVEYVADALKLFDDETINISFEDAEHPFLFTDSGNCTALVMPMRL